MRDALTDDYVAFVQERLRDVRQECTDPQGLIEQRLDFSHMMPGGFGTGHCVIIAEPVLHIIGLKHGQGVTVEAEHYPQLMLYALGALNAFGSLYDISEVAVTIFQPRRSNVSTWSIPVAELGAWAEQVVKPLAILAASGDGEFVNVVLMEVGEDIIPAKMLRQMTSEEAREDFLLRERSLLYVAATRARDNLYVTYVGKRSPMLPVGGE